MDEQSKPLVAGPELDALVAEKVLGCTVTRRDDGVSECGCADKRHASEYGIYYLPYYSTDGEASLRVLKFMLADTRIFNGREFKRYSMNMDADTSGLWSVDFMEYVGNHTHLSHVGISQASLAEAICLAALKAKSAT